MARLGSAGGRILIVWGDQWPRALLRAQLLDEGYDALGAPDLLSALTYPEAESERGPVRVAVLNQEAAEGAAPGRLATLRKRHPSCLILLLAKGLGAVPEGPWDAVLRRPVRIRDVVAAIERLLRRSRGESDGRDGS